MRTFIAVSLPKEIKDFLSRIQEQLRSSGADVKWVHPENIHLTLKFLGEIEDNQIEQLTALLQETVKGKSAFAVRLSSIGAFPKISSPRVIWVGIDKGDSDLQQISGELERRCGRIGIPEEDRPFSSHITLGRVRSGLNRQKLASDLDNLKDNPDLQGREFTVDKVTLFKSTLTPKGPIYEPLSNTILATS
jgi:2'-5' RNA ligase